MGKPRSHKPSIASKAFDLDGRSPWGEYVVNSRRSVQDVFKGKDISAKVDRAAGPDLLPKVDPAVEYGFSGEVSRGKRPVHKAGKRSYKRV